MEHFKARTGHLPCPLHWCDLACTREAFYNVPIFYPHHNPPKEKKWSPRCPISHLSMPSGRQMWYISHLLWVGGRRCAHGHQHGAEERRCNCWVVNTCLSCSGILPHLHPLYVPLSCLEGRLSRPEHPGSTTALWALPMWHRWWWG